jgi:hypothetical protein
VRLRPAPPRIAAKSGKVAVTLLLALWCAPGFASAGYAALCDKSQSSPIDLDVPVQKLSIIAVDYGNASLVSAGDAMPESTDDLNIRSPSVSIAPRVETILREIFDESIPADQKDADATASSPANTATLEELTAPVLREQSRNIDKLENSDIRDAEGNTTRANTSVPGVAEDELSRFRRQMFRTDI